MVSRSVHNPTLARAKETFDIFLRPLRNFLKNPRRGLEAPRSTLDNIRRASAALMEEQLCHETPETFLRRLFDVIPPEMEGNLAALLAAQLDSERAELRRTPAGEEFLALYDAAKGNGPCSPLLVMVENPLGDGPVHMLSAFAAWDAAQRVRGERRFQKLVDAVPDLVEKIYGRHLRVVWALSFLGEGQWPPPPPRLGALAADKRLRRFPSLVDHEAGRIRNAVAHRSLRYIPREGAVELREDREATHPAKASWQVTMTLEAFESRLEAMLQVVGPITTRLRSLITQELFLESGVYDALPLIKTALGGDPAAINALDEKNINAVLEGQLFRSPPPSDVDLWFMPGVSERPMTATPLDAMDPERATDSEARSR